MNTSQGPHRSQGRRRAYFAVAVLLCAVFCLLAGLGSLSADAASTLAMDADPAGTAVAAAAGLTASDDAGAAEAEDALGQQPAESAPDAAVSTQASTQSGSFSYVDNRNPFKFCCQVLVNREWKYVTPDGRLVDYPSSEADYFSTTYHSGTWASSGRLFVWGEELETAYGPLFGFTTAQLAASASSPMGNYLFGVADHNNLGVIWNDLAPWNVSFGVSGTVAASDARWVIPLVIDNTGNRSGAAHLYYLPANYESTDHPRPDSFYGGETKLQYKATSDEQLIADNTFYSVSVADDGNLIYAADEKVPAMKYVLAGKSVEVTVKVPTAGSGISWSFIRGVDYVTPDGTVFNSNGTVTYTFENLDNPIYLAATREGDLDLNVTYEAATLKDSLVPLGSDVSVDRQRVTVDGLVYGRESVTQQARLDGTLTLPNLDGDRQVIKVERIGSGSATVAGGRCFWYTFAGWQVVSCGKAYTFEAGTTLSSGQLRLLSSGGTDITFRALWTAQDADTKRIQSANFYVNINFEIADNMTNGTQNALAKDFTDSIFSTRVNGGYGLKGNGGLSLLSPPTADSDAYSVDSILRKLVTYPYYPDDSSLYNENFRGITFDSFPTDSEVLDSVRNSSKTLTEDGKVIDKSTITTDNYTVRWYSFKYLVSDGWHVDGVLVRKVGRLTVTKTFAGDPNAVAKGKENFSIAVTHEVTDAAGVATTVTDYNLTLDPADGAGAGNTGYTSYDAATDTYTWAISTRQGSEYTIAEKDYTAPTDTWNTGCWYKVSNSAAATDGWAHFVPTSAPKVVAESYATDTPVEACQTIAFRNVYVRSDTVHLSKVDSVTGNPLSGVSFTLERLTDSGRESASLYQRSDGSSFYSILSNEEYKTAVDGGKVKTGTDGNIYIVIGAALGTQVEGTYDLMEDVPVGYKGAAGVRFTVNASGRLSSAVEIDADHNVLTDIAPDKSLISVGDQDSNGYASLTIKNNPERLTTVTASKDWGSTPEEDRLPVTVSLWRNGAKLQDRGDESYTQVLDASNNWSYTWEDLPLFLDGKLAEYVLREDKIGTTDFDSTADSDGYANYLVTQDEARYSDGSPVGTDPSAFNTKPYWRDDAGTWHYATHALLTIHNLPVTGDLAFSKVDGDGHPLAGALFYLYADGFQEGDAPVVSQRSDPSGYVVFSALQEGTYWLREREAPKGYVLDETLYKVVVSRGIATMTRPDGESATPVTSITNRFNAQITVHKVNSRREGLPGATMELLRIEGEAETVVATGVTNAGGVVEFAGLESGRYVICETGAPAGYELPEEDDVAFLTVEEGRILFDRGSGSSWKYYDGITVDQGALFVTDTPLFDLPTAGGPGLAGFVGGGCALMCGAAWLWLRRRGGGCRA